MQEANSDKTEKQRTNEISYYVALDLGSESMSAYFEEKDYSKFDMVDLQAHAKTLLGQDPEYLMEEVENLQKKSPRLRTRIFIRDRKQPSSLSLNHAKLDFIHKNGTKLPGYDESLFGLFAAPNTWVLGGMMPNPKIPFQYGAQEIIPEVEPQGGGIKVKHNPEVLIQHLTAQIVRNLVLLSPELQNVDPSSIELLLTVPNVYSLPHVESLCSFLQTNSGVKTVRAVSESDAAVYFVLDLPRNTDLTEVSEFKGRIRNRKDKDYLRIVSIDIGRGTTDLSAIEVKPPLNSQSPQNLVRLAVVGKSDGGNRLSYILAEYFNKQFIHFRPRIESTLGKSVRFSFLEKEPTIPTPWSEAIVALETLIERIKRSITEKHYVGLQSDQTITNRILSKICQLTDPNWQDNNADKFQALLDELTDQGFLSLPDYLPRGLRRWWWQIFYKSNRLKQIQCDLSIAIEKYVQENVSELLSQLVQMYAARDARYTSKVRSAGKDLFDHRCTFVVILGQAAQLAPIRSAIRSKLSEFDFPWETNMLCLDGPIAKEACCKGAVSYARSKAKLTNDDELMGTFGMLSRVTPFGSEQSFKMFNMSEINSARSSSQVSFPAKSEALLFYSSRLYTNGESPGLFDGYTAIIKTFEGSEFTFRYDRPNRKIYVNDILVDKLATYGDIQESIYYKVWPEVLKPMQ
ncbi:MAG: hypothetical protein HY707_04680 [Ignavibacteriae bacterium]|nr:hypothetical protein [Ignavibacteriota bacterium]